MIITMRHVNHTVGILGQTVWLFLSYKKKTKHPKCAFFLLFLTIGDRTECCSCSVTICGHSSVDCASDSKHTLSETEWTVCFTLTGTSHTPGSPGGLISLPLLHKTDMQGGVGRNKVKSDGDEYKGKKRERESVFDAFSQKSGYSIKCAKALHTEDKWNT